MSGIRRRLLYAKSDISLLPAGFTRLQYIYTDTNAYIDTDILINSDDIIDLQWVELTGHNTGDRMVCGVRPSLFSVNLYYGTTNPHMAWGNSGGFSIYNSLDQRIRVEKGMFYTYSDGKINNTIDKTSYTFAATKNIYLFCWNNGNDVTQYPLKLVGVKYFFVENKQKFAKKVHIFCFDIGLFFKKTKNKLELFVIDGNGFDAGSFVTNIFDNVFSMDNIQIETFKKEVFAQYERIDKKNLLVQKFDKMD